LKSNGKEVFLLFCAIQKPMLQTSSIAGIFKNYSAIDDLGNTFNIPLLTEEIFFLALCNECVAS